MLPEARRDCIPVPYIGCFHSEQRLNKWKLLNCFTILYCRLRHGKMIVNDALYRQVILAYKWGTSGEEDRNGRRFLYESGRKHLLRSDPSTTCSQYCLQWRTSAVETLKRNRNILCATFSPAVLPICQPCRLMRDVHSSRVAYMPTLPSNVWHSFEPCCLFANLAD
jgi:hypothetical protein